MAVDLFLFGMPNMLLLLHQFFIFHFQQQQAHPRRSMNSIQRYTLAIVLCFIFCAFVAISVNNNRVQRVAAVSKERDDMTAHYQSSVERQAQATASKEFTENKHQNDLLRREILLRTQLTDVMAQQRDEMSKELSVSKHQNDVLRTQLKEKRDRIAQMSSEGSVMRKFRNEATPPRLTCIPSFLNGKLLLVRDALITNNGVQMSGNGGKYFIGFVGGPTRLERAIVDQCNKNNTHHQYELLENTTNEKFKACADAEPIPDRFIVPGKTTIRWEIWSYNGLQPYHGLFGPSGLMNLFATKKSITGFLKDIGMGEEFNLFMEDFAHFPNDNGDGSSNLIRKMLTTVFGYVPDQTGFKKECRAGPWFLLGVGAPTGFYHQFHKTLASEPVLGVYARQVQAKLLEAYDKECDFKMPKERLVFENMRLWSGNDFGGEERRRGIEPTIGAALVKSVKQATGRPLRFETMSDHNFCGQYTIARSADFVLLSEGAGMLWTLFTPGATYLMVTDYHEEKTKDSALFDGFHFAFAYFFGVRIIVFEVCTGRPASYEALEGELAKPFKTGVSGVECGKYWPKKDRISTWTKGMDRFAYHDGESSQE